MKIRKLHMLYYLRSIAILLLIILTSCNEKPKQKKAKEQEVLEKRINDSIALAKDSIQKAQQAKEEEHFVLTEENAIPFLFEYEKTHKPSKVKIYTSMGSFTINLFEN